MLRKPIQIANRNQAMAMRKDKLENNFYKIKSLPNAGVKDVDTVGRIVTGVSNTMSYFDYDYDIFMPGSTKKTLAARGPKSLAYDKILNVKDHDLRRRIGVPQVLVEKDVDGMWAQYFETAMIKNTDGNDTLIEYQSGAINQHSIALQYMDIEYIDAESAGWKKALDAVMNPEDMDKAGFAFLVHEIKQIEFSPVSFGANKLTPFLGVKSEDKGMLLIKFFDRMDQLKHWLKHGKQSDDRMIEYELEILQLKQYVKEMFDDEPSLKEILIGNNAKRVRLNEDENILEVDIHGEEMKKDAMVTGRICTNCMISFNAPTGRAQCPECGQYVDDNGTRYPNVLDIGKSIEAHDFSQYFK